MTGTIDDIFADYTGQPEAEEMQRGSFEERFRSRRVDLFQRIEDGAPAVVYLPASDRMLVRGKRHHSPGPKKTGKSFGWLRHSVDMVLAGARVAILDRENGADLYAQRLDLIMAAGGLDDEQRATLRAGISYYEFPSLRDYDRDDLAAELGDRDLVIFDSQRRFLSDMGLDEDSSDDYATFAAATIDVLFEHGIATLVQDNTGHQDQTRGRGSSAKGDLNEVSFILETIEAYSQSRVGKIRLRLEPGASRFGGEGTWDMTIGAGVFGPWELVRLDDERENQHADTRREITEWIIARVLEHPEGVAKTETVDLCRAAHESASRKTVENVYEHLLTGSDPRASRGTGNAANSKALYPALQESFPLPEPQTGTTGTTAPGPDSTDSFPASRALKEAREAGSAGEGDPDLDEIERLLDKHADIAGPPPAAAAEVEIPA